MDLLHPFIHALTHKVMYKFIRVWSNMYRILVQVHNNRSCKTSGWLHPVGRQKQTSFHISRNGYNVKQSAEVSAVAPKQIHMFFLPRFELILLPWWRIFGTMNSLQENEEMQQFRCQNLKATRKKTRTQKIKEKR